MPKRTIYDVWKCPHQTVVTCQFIKVSPMGCAHEGVCCYVFSSQRTTDSEGIKKNKSEIVVKWNKSQSLITIKHMTYDDHNTKMSYALLYYSFIVILM